MVETRDGLLKTRNSSSNYKKKMTHEDTNVVFSD